jgi:exopolyphosphatase / guanosine-5'-triphosphate,3'-diphosphate pyrophosphatase
VVAYACIDIGSNTTRMLVAEVDDGRLRELVTQRAFTRVGKGLKRGKAISQDKIEDLVEVVERQVQSARAAGADEVSIVATAALRDAANGSEVSADLESRVGVPVRILSGEDEARLSFLGATKTLGAPVSGEVCVIDVGGGSTEVVIGSVREGVSWSASFRIGSGFLADSYLRSDPPSASELESVRRHVSGFFEGLELPQPDRAVAVGGTASSLRRLAGAEVAHDTLERSIMIVASASGGQVAERFELDPERIRVLPGGILIFEALSDKLGMPLTVGKGGLREGVVLDLVAGKSVAR